MPVRLCAYPRYIDSINSPYWVLMNFRFTFMVGVTYPSSV
jgi:hypothetical protein